MKRQLVIAFDVFLLLLAIGCAFLSFVAIHHDVQVARVVSDSMAPTIHRGDTLIFRSKPTMSISDGDIALLPLADDSGEAYVHRIVSNSKNPNKSVTVVTKGDANPLPDSWRLTITSQSVPIYFATLPTKLIPMMHINKWAVLAFSGFILVLLTRFIFSARSGSQMGEDV